MIPLQSTIVYGPVRSRRLGASLGVNVLPPGRKICNFNCAYCQYGWTTERPELVRDDEWHAPDIIADAVRLALRDARTGDSAVDRITLAGNGEPTLHPRFVELVTQLHAVRDAEYPSARLALLSNSGTLLRPGIAGALDRLDEVYLKLDTADPVTFRRLNGTSLDLEDLIAALGRISHVTIQSLFTRDASGRIDNTTPAAVEAWIAALARIRPAAVHIYSLDRGPAWSALQVIAREELEAIAARVRAAGLQAITFG